MEAQRPYGRAKGGDDVPATVTKKWGGVLKDWIINGVILDKYDVSPELLERIPSIINRIEHFPVE